MKKINVDDCFVKSDWESKGKALDRPKDFEVAEKIDTEMKVVSRRASNMFARSHILARKIFLPDRY